MQFASLMSSWFAIALPVIVIMYLLKKQYDDTDISSHLLWQRVLKQMEANRPWQRLRNHILLYLQLLIAALIVFAMMQPFFWIASDEHDHHIIVIDQSASMSAYINDEPDSDTRLAHVKQAVNRWLQQKRGQQITLIGMGKDAEVLALREPDRQLIARLLSEMEINYGRTAYDETLSLAASLAQDGDASIHVYTDGQMNESVQHIAWPSMPTIHLVGQEHTNNVSIVQFGVKRNAASSNTVTAVATFRNWGTEPVTSQTVLQTAAGERTEQQVLLPADEQVTLFYHDLPMASYYHLQLQVADMMKVDNDAFATLADEEARMALLLTPGNMFLEKALQLGGISIIKSQADSQGLMIMPLEDVDMVIIDRIEPEALASAEWQTLLASKPVWFIHHEVAAFELAQPGQDYAIRDHPLTHYIQLHNTHIAEVQVFADIGWGEAVVTADELPLIYAGQVNGWPRVMFTFDLHRSDLPLRAEFPVLVSNTVQWLASAQAHSLGAAIAGEMLALSLMTATEQAVWQAVNDESLFIAAEGVQGAVSHIQMAPSEPGLYRFIEQDGQGFNIQERLLHVMMDQREANLAHTVTLITDGSTTEQAGAPQEEHSEHVVSQSLVPWIVALIILVIVLEWEVYRRGSTI